MNQGFTYHLLTTEERAGIVEEFSSRGFRAPGPEALVMGAFRDGILSGFQVLQPQLHAEPLVVYDPHCVKGLSQAIDELVQGALGAGSRYFVLAEGRVAELAEGLGWKPRPEKLFEKVVV